MQFNSGLISEDGEDDPGKALYKVRSKLFHNIREFPNNYPNYLNELNCAFELFIIEILLNFKYP